ncbi:MAG: hypothetical protein FJ202_00120 [Gemmatimonadetes bacterium]|nr:hypothetical protein [Gemmatimonadota bacterium]
MSSQPPVVRLGLLTLLAALGCGGGGGVPSEPLVATTARAEPSTAPRTATVASTLAGPFEATFLASGNRAVPGLAVTCTADNGGSIGTPSTTTDGSGRARCTGWTLGTATGPNTLTISSAGVSTQYAVTATADAPAALQLSAAPPPTFRSGVALTSNVTVQLRDRFGNASPIAGRRVTAQVSGGTGITRLSIPNADPPALATDQFGVATFTGLRIAGRAGSRTLSFAADSIAQPVTVPLTLLGGLPVALTMATDLPGAATLGTVIAPTPVVAMADSVGNAAAGSGTLVTATIAGELDALGGNTATTDADGRASFSGLTFYGAASSRTVTFSAQGLQPVTSRSVATTLPDASLRPARITASTSASDSLRRALALGNQSASAQMTTLATNASGGTIASTGVRWVVRDSTRARVSTSGVVTGVRPGRTFVVAQSPFATAVADSVLIHVPSGTTGPVLRTGLDTYRLAVVDTFSIVVQLELRDGQSVMAGDFEVSWPGASSFPYSPFTVTGFNALQPNMILNRGDVLGDQLRVTWAGSTPASGVIPLVILRCRVNQRGVGNQIVLTVNQLVSATLADLTAAVSVMNPVVIIP